MNISSCDVVIRGLIERELSVHCQSNENVLANDILCVHYIQNDVPRQQHVYKLQEVSTRYFCHLWKVLDGDSCLLPRKFLLIFFIEHDPLSKSNSRRYSPVRGQIYLLKISSVYGNFTLKCLFWVFLENWACAKKLSNILLK